MKMLELSGLAYGKWDGILTTLGADPKYLKGTNKPCPFCGGTDRYSYSDEGVGKWFCRQCGHGDGFDWLQKLHGWDLKKAMTEVEAIVGTVQTTTIKPEQDPESKARYMRKIWKESAPISQGDPVWIYLSRRCGDLAGALEDIRFHPSLAHSVDGGKHPAMLARMRSFDGKRGIGIHRTYLTRDGQKAQVDPIRMSYGEVGTVRLGPAQTHLGIAEGIETAICAARIFGLPVWAATSANGLQAWEPPEGVTSVVICGDNDVSATGQAAAWALARRLRVDGMTVAVRIPDTVGTDWADPQNGMVA